MPQQAVRVFAALLVLLPVTAPFLRGQAPARPKAGDWANYEEIVQFKEMQVKTVTKVTITDVDATGKVTKAFSAESAGEVSLLKSLDSSIDLGRDFLDADPRIIPKAWVRVATTSVTEGAASLDVAGRQYACTWVESTGKFGDAGTWTRKIWICPDLAIFDRPMAEMTQQGEGYPQLRLTRRLLAFGSAGAQGK